MITNFTSNLLTRNTLGPKTFMFISFLFNSCASNNAKKKLRHFQANHKETKERLALLISVYLHEENNNNNHNIKIINILQCVRNSKHFVSSWQWTLRPENEFRIIMSHFNNWQLWVFYVSVAEFVHILCDIDQNTKKLYFKVKNLPVKR